MKAENLPPKVLLMSYSYWCHIHIVVLFTVAHICGTVKMCVPLRAFTRGHPRMNRIKEHWYYWMLPNGTILVLMLPFGGYCQKDYHLMVMLNILALALFDPDWTPCQALWEYPPGPRQPPWKDSPVVIFKNRQIRSSVFEREIWEGNSRKSRARFEISITAKETNLDKSCYGVRSLVRSGHFLK